MISLKRYVKNNGNSGNISPHKMRLMHGGLFLLSLLLLAVSAVTSNAYAQAQVSVGSLDAPINVPVMVPVVLAAPGDKPPATLLLGFAYDESMIELLDVVIAPNAEQTDKNVDYELQNGEIKVALFGGVASVPEGVMLYLKVRVMPTVEADTVLPITDLPSQGANSAEEHVDVQVNSGNLRVVETPDGHSADTEPDWTISLEELLRVVQLYNAQEYHCDVAGEDGYASGNGAQDCLPHDADYVPADWRISFSELLRMIQLYNAPFRMYHVDPDNEDGFAPGPIGYVP